ncbi:MAG: HAD family hydrolase [Armatimonadota bacterium]
MSFASVRAVLFDLDGTLVHTHIDFPAMKRTVLELVSGHGLDPAPYAELDVLSAIQAACAALERPEPFRSGAEAALEEIELAACEGAYAAEGAAETLDWLRSRGIGVGIVTRNSRKAVERVLAGLPLPYEVLLTRADTPRVKPDPAHLLLALERLGAEPDRAVMVGDHRMDVTGGKSAGMRTLGILTPGRPADYFDPVAPDGVIRRLAELRSWIYPSSS